MEFLSSRRAASTENVPWPRQFILRDTRYEKYYINIIEIIAQEGHGPIGGREKANNTRDSNYVAVGEGEGVTVSSDKLMRFEN